MPDTRIGGTVEDPACRVVDAAGADDVQLRPQDFPHYQCGEDSQREVAYGDCAHEPAPVHPVRSGCVIVHEMQETGEQDTRLGELPDDENPPARACEGGERQHPDRVLGRKNFVGEQERHHDQEQHLRYPGAAGGAPTHHDDGE
jgi:hypothetical protein